MMINTNRVRPIGEHANGGLEANGAALTANGFTKEVNDIDSISTTGMEESYLKLKPFTKLDPSLVRLLSFLGYFGLTVNIDLSLKSDKTIKRANPTTILKSFLRLLCMLVIGVLSAEVVYDVNLRQSKLLVEQKRSTPLLTFVIVAYSWLTLVIPLICDLSLVLIGSNLFRFYSRTTSTVCNGIFFGKKTSVDKWYYYAALIVIAFFDVVGQVVLLGVWPKSIDPYMKILLMQNKDRITSEVGDFGGSLLRNSSIGSGALETEDGILTLDDPLIIDSEGPKIRAYLLDYLLGERHAHGDLGVCIKIICLMIQFIHSNAFLMIIISFANHYATAINNINDNLDKYEFRRLLRQLIILRDSSEQISLMISLPFSLITALVFMRQIALNGVYIQSTMLAYENWAVSLQSITSIIITFMVFIYCDGLQSASRQTHRLKTEQTVVYENKGGNQSIYEFLDYLDRLSKSIRITFFNIISINKSSLVGLYGHILTLTFVTS